MKQILQAMTAAQPHLEAAQQALDAHVAGVDVGQLNPTQLCTTWKAARPLLVFASTFPFIPATYRAIIVALLAAGDSQCP